MRQGLKDRIQFNPSDPPRMSRIKTDYLTRQSFNKRVGNANCAPNGGCSNTRDASGIYIGKHQQEQMNVRQYYAPFRQPVKGWRKTLYGNPDKYDPGTTWATQTRNCLTTTEIYKDTYSLSHCNDNCTNNGTISTSKIPLTGSQSATKTFSGNYSRTNRPLIRSGMQPNIAGKQNSGLSGTPTAVRYSYSYRELINNRRKDTQIKKLATEKPVTTDYMSNPQRMPGYGGDCCGAGGVGQSIYRYNNPNFAVQGAVEASDRITRLKMDTIKGATKCAPGETTTYDSICNGVYSTGNLQTARTKVWPKGITVKYKNAQVKYAALFNENHDEVNYPQVSALARVRGSSGNKRLTTGKIIEDGGNVCAKSCGPQLLM